MTASDTEVAIIRDLLEEYADEIDYVLVTPSTRYMRAKLEGIAVARLIYDKGGFAIYRIGEILYSSAGWTH